MINFTSRPDLVFSDFYCLKKGLFGRKSMLVAVHLGLGKGRMFRRRVFKVKVIYCRVEKLQTCLLVSGFALSQYNHDGKSGLNSISFIFTLRNGRNSPDFTSRLYSVKMHKFVFIQYL